VQMACVRFAIYKADIDIPALYLLAAHPSSPLYAIFKGFRDFFSPSFCPTVSC